MTCSRSAEAGGRGGRRRAPAAIAALTMAGLLGGPLALETARAAGPVVPLVAPQTSAADATGTKHAKDASSEAPPPPPALAPILSPAPPPPTLLPAPPPAPAALAPTAPAEQGDAEPAPPEPPPPGLPAGLPPDFAPRNARHRVAVSGRFAYRLGAAAEEAGAHAGFGIGGTYEYTYATAASRLELALGTDFSLDRFGSSEKGTLTEGGVVTTYDATRVILQNAFLLVHTAAADLGPARPFVTIGAGLGVGNLQTVSPSFTTMTGSSTSFHDLQFLARASAGLDVVVTRVWRASLRVDYTAVRLADQIPTVSGTTLPAFVDLLDVNLGLVYRF